MADEPAKKPEVTNTAAPTPTETPASAPAPASPATPGSKSAKSSNKNLFIIIAVIVLLAGGAYYKNQQDKKNAEKTAENLIGNLFGGDIDVDSKDNSFSIKDEDGDTTLETSQKLPDDFPKDSVPYLEDEKVTLVFTNTYEGKKSWSVTTTVDKSVEEAVAYFEGVIVEPKYTDIGTYGSNESTTFSANTAEYGVFVTVGKDSTDDDTTVSYVITQN
jgi:hypothetical protein